MKPINKIVGLAFGAIAPMLGACSSDSMEMPAGPELPVTGPEVSTSVIYQANPRFFASGGCLKALTSQLDDIADMGTDVLWVMPVQQPGVLNAIGSPYCISDFKSINSRYGDMNDFRNLVEAAHAKGMKVILDWVANHTSWDNIWITEHPEYYAKDSEGNIVQASTWPDVAQLDYSQESTRAAMTDAMRYWVETAGIDGFRCDYAEGVPHDYWQSVISTLRGIRADLLILAESRDKSFYDDGFDMIYDWEFAPALQGAFNGGKPSDLFSKATETWKDVPEGKQLLRYAFNHDFAAENAIDTTYGSEGGTMGAYVLAAMLHGTPMIYSSMDAEGVTGKQSFFTYHKLNWSADRRAEFKRINNIYKTTAEVRRGELTTYNDANVAVFTRTTAEHTLLVMVNTTASEQTVKTPIVLAGEAAENLKDGGSATLGTTETIEPYGYRVYLK